MKLFQVHWDSGTSWHGEHDSLVLTGCGKRVALRENRQRLTREPREITCKARGCHQHKRRRSA
jgi:hypothetical protein